MTQRLNLGREWRPMPFWKAGWTLLLLLALNLPSVALADSEALLDGSAAATRTILESEFKTSTRQTGGLFFLESFFQAQGQPGEEITLEAVLNGQSLGESRLTVRYGGTLQLALAEGGASGSGFPTMQLVVELESSGLIVHGMAFRFPGDSHLVELGLAHETLLIPIAIYKNLRDALEAAESVAAGSRGLDGAFSTSVTGRSAGGCGPDFDNVTSASDCTAAAFSCSSDPLFDAVGITLACAARHFSAEAYAQWIAGLNAIQECVDDAREQEGVENQLLEFSRCLGLAFPPGNVPGFVGCLTLGLYEPFSELLDCSLCSGDCQCGRFGDCPSGQELTIYGRASGLCPGEQVQMRAACSTDHWTHRSSGLIYKAEQNSDFAAFNFPESSPCYAYEPFVGGPDLQTHVAVTLEGVVEMQPGKPETPGVGRECTPPVIEEEIHPTTLIQAGFHCYSDEPCDTGTFPISAYLSNVDPLGNGSFWTVSATLTLTGGPAGPSVPGSPIQLTEYQSTVLNEEAPAGSHFSIRVTPDALGIDCWVVPAGGTVDEAISARVTCIDNNGLANVPWGPANLPRLDFPGEVSDDQIGIPQICFATTSHESSPQVPCSNPYTCPQPLPPLPPVNPCYCDGTTTITEWRCNKVFFPSIPGTGFFTVNGPRLAASSPNVAQPGLPVLSVDLEVADPNGLSKLFVFDGTDLLEIVDLGGASQVSWRHQISAEDLGAGEHLMQYVAFDSGGAPVSGAPGAPNGVYLVATVQPTSTTGPATLEVVYQGSPLAFDDAVWLGSTPEGVAGPTRQLTLVNHGGESLNVGVTVTDSTIEVVRDVTTVAPGAQQGLRLRLTGETGGPVSSYVYLDHDAPDHPVQDPMRFALYGDVVPVGGCAADNAGPAVTLSSHQPGDVVPQGPLDFEASASDESGVANVVFLLDGIEIGQDPTLPYQAPWTAVPGTYSMEARAVDACGNTAFSGPVEILVALSCEAPLDPPSAEIFAPSAGTRRPPGWTAIRAYATSLAGIDSVEFTYRPSGSSVWQSMGVDVEIYDGEWSRGRSWPEGDWEVRATAMDACGNQGESQVLPLDVSYDCSGAAGPPSVEIFAPAEGATRPVGWTAVRADASSSNRVSSVEFFYREDGSSAWLSLGEDTEVNQGEWSRGRSWPAGDWQVKAEAFDFCGSATSDVVSFTVQE